MSQGGARSGAPPSSLGIGFWLKLVFIGLFDALALLTVPTLVSNRSWLLLIALGAITIVLNWAYVSPRAQAVRWLFPGLVFLALFVVWPVIFTFYIALTNWSTGNNLTKEQVVARLEAQPIRDPGEGRSLELALYRDPSGELAFLVRDAEGATFFGTPRPADAEPDPDALLDLDALGIEVGEEPPDQIGDYDRLNLRDALAISSELQRLVLDLPERGIVRVDTPTQATLVAATTRYTYDPATDSVFDAELGVTCTAQEGNFVCPDGTRIDPGWRVVTGFDNFAAIAANRSIRTPFLQVFAWNVVFAVASVVLTFAVGLFLANALQDERLRGRALYRSVLIIPYAVPAFLAILVWRGLLNDQFGQVNDLISRVGVDAIPWLRHPVWAKVAVLLVNTWLGFPYMFLIASGALQAIPAELKEAARVDGAGAWRVFRTVTLPLLLVSTAPLLIGSFAFNFNNFVLIFMLTNGGPPIAGAAVPYGATDILISFTFDLAIQSGRGNNFGLGSAIVILIFVVVAVASAISFRFTRRLEELYG